MSEQKDWMWSTMEMVVTTVLAAFLSALWCGVCVFEYAKNEAVAAGHAHYYIDENNKRQWEWLPPCTSAESEATDE